MGAIFNLVIGYTGIHYLGEYTVLIVHISVHFELHSVF
jgi:hypothetical protein